MPLWNYTVDVLREAIFAYAQLGRGNVACGIMAVTLLARLALFPLTLRLARAAAAQQAVMRRIAPELETVRAKFKNDPVRISEETRRILGREGVPLVPAAGCIGALLQMPVLLALFDAVRQAAAVGGRFLWIRDISRPDIVLGVLVAAVTAAGVITSPQPDASAQNRLLLVSIPAVVTFVALWKMAAGVGLYWGVSSAVGAAQALIVRHGPAERSH